MKVFGIDPGSTVTGYGIVEACGSKVRHVDNGGIHVPSSEPFPQRLGLIYRGIAELIRRFSPDAVAIESVFVAKNVSSTIKLGAARGAAMLAAVNAHVPVVEYAPCQVKLALTGYGAARKEQIQLMVKTLLGLPDVAFEDASDALAIAICHCQSHGLRDALSKASPARTPQGRECSRNP